MTQRNAKIRDALKTQYADFADFCVSLDKQYIFELTTSDFIAFRTHYIFQYFHLVRKPEEQISSYTYTIRLPHLYYAFLCDLVYVHRQLLFQS